MFGCWLVWMDVDEVRRMVADKKDGFWMFWWMVESWVIGRKNAVFMLV